MDGDLSVLKTTQLFLSLLHTRMKQSYFFFFNHSVQSNNPNFLPPAAAIDFTLCVKLHLPALASAANEFQTERKKEEEEEKKQGISHCSPSFSLDHNNTISIYNFNC